MSTEHPVEPSLIQRVEEVQDELRARQRALGPLPEENAQLRARLGSLQTEAEELRREVEALQQGQSVTAPRLPENLSPPFEARTQRSLRGPLTNLLFFSVCVSLLLVRAGLEAWPWAAGAEGFLVAVWLWSVLAPTGWRFSSTSMKPVGLSLREQRETVSYADIREVKVLVTRSQQRRGVGTVAVRHARGSALIRNVSEPERLAEWLRSKQEARHG